MLKVWFANRCVKIVPAGSEKDYRSDTVYYTLQAGDDIAQLPFWFEKAEEIAGQYRISYVALVEPGNVQEQAGYAKLSMSGVLQDGKTSFLASSGGHDYGNKASLMINDEEMAYNHRGMNIVVFDPERGIVIDSVRFKEYAK